MVGQGRHSGNRLRTLKNDLGCLLNRAKRFRNEKVMALLVQGTARKGLVVRDGKRPKRGPGEGSGTRPGLDTEGNDARLPSQKWVQNVFGSNVCLGVFN